MTIAKTPKQIAEDIIPCQSRPGCQYSRAINRVDDHDANCPAFYRRRVAAAIQSERDRPTIRPITAGHIGHPDYCPDNLAEDAPCPECGASVENLLPCGAIHNGRRPGPLVQLTVVER